MARVIRLPNSRVDGAPFGFLEQLAVWEKADPIPGDASHRLDRCGAIISFDDYGKDTAFGWEIDHIRPVSKGGSDALDNLQPLHWRNNRGKSDEFPQWNCVVGGF